MLLVVGCVEARQYTPLPPSVPQLRLPQNGAYEGSTVAGLLKAQFAWEPSIVDMGTVTYELQYSPNSSFASDVVTVQTEFLAHRTEGALQVSTLPPVGRRYYWHVRACLKLCSEYSQTWAVNVGRSSKDFNGDGYADVVLGTPSSDEQGIDAGRAYVYFGGPGSMDIVADGVLSNGSAGDRFGYAVSSAGDFNDDGFADVVVGAPFANVGRAFVYFGGSGATFDAVPDVILSEGAAGDAFGLSVAGLGDLNGDGFSEIAVGAPWRDIGRAYLYSGGRGGQLDVADGILTGGAIGSQFAAHVTSGGDVNADGLADVIINEYLADEGFLRRCSSHVYLGTSGKDLSSLQEHVLVGDVVDSCLMRLAGAHDVDLDGASDLLAIVNTSYPLRLPHMEQRRAA
jgi:FG-GAP repeat